MLHLAHQPGGDMHMEGELQISADGEGDDVGWELIAGEEGPSALRTATTTTAASISLDLHDDQAYSYAPTPNRSVGTSWLLPQSTLSLQSPATLRVAKSGFRT